MGLGLVDGHDAWRHVGHTGKGKAREQGAELESLDTAAMNELWNRAKAEETA